jgi:putative ubiquitin-RnfH superfamily antitoxin RatB of RatAB toxin-antitoxin module
MPFSSVPSRFMDNAESLLVEVAHAMPRRQLILELRVVEGTTVEQAIRASGILEQFPDIDLKSGKVGIFGKPCKLTDILTNGDRIEIYRPLIADPKEIRKQRAAKGKDMKKGAGSQE